MWMPITRQQHSRPATRYQTDLTDAEWRVIAPHLPKPCATGRPREWPMREIVNGIFYVMRAGCPWRLVPSDLPPWETIYRWFAVWRDEGRFERINHALVMADRERVGRDASPSAAIIDSQSVKTGRGRRPARLRCGQEGQRAQAPRARRPRRAWPRARTASGEHPGSRRRRTASASLAAHLPVHSARLRRQRICRGEGHRGHVDRHRNRAPLLTQGAGSSSGSSPGLGAIGDWQKTSRPPSTRHAPSSTPHPLCYSCVGLPVLHDFRNRLSVFRGLPQNRYTSHRIG
jgi:transposase